MTLKEQIMKLQTYKMYEGEDTVYVERDDVIKALEQESCECKQVDIDKFKEILKNNPPIISVLEQEPCEDCISREAVHDLIATWLSDYLLDDTREVLEVIDEKVEDLPSVIPKESKD